MRINHIRQLQKKSAIRVFYVMMLFLFIMIGGNTWAAVEDYAGVYSGEYDGDDEGIWTADFKPDGNGRMIIWSWNYFSGYSGTGTVNLAGQYFIMNTAQGFYANGSIDSNSGVTGTWEVDGDQGDFGGQKSGVTAYQAYVGTYNGTYTGDYEGTGTLCIEADGRVSGQTYNASSNFTEQIKGAFVNQDEMLACSDYSTFYAELTSGVTFVGKWYRANDGTSGDFQFVKISDTLECGSNSSTGGGGGGGGGGCFISGPIYEQAAAWFVHRSWIGLMLLIGLGMTLVFRHGSMTKRKKARIKWAEIVICPVFLFFFTGCGTTMKYNVESAPPGALVMVHEKEDDPEQWMDIKGETPLETKVLFFKEDPKFMTAEKRGYEPSTITLTAKDTETNLSLPLKRIEGVSEDIFDVERLREAKFRIFPSAIEVYIHSGVGNLDKIEKNTELTDKVTNDFYEELMKQFDPDKAARVFESETPADWEALSGKINKYLSKLNEKRLKYLSQPPLLEEVVQEFKPLKSEAPAGDDSEPPFYIYLYARCVSETTGRKVGSMLVSLLAINRTGYYYASDTGTMVKLYFIDSRTSEVLHIESQYFGQNLTKPDQLAKVAQMVAAMIQREEKK